MRNSILFVKKNNGQDLIIKVMRRFDKNLNVTNKNIPFFHCLRDRI